MSWINQVFGGATFRSWKPLLDRGVIHGFGNREFTYNRSHREDFIKKAKIAFNVDKVFDATQVHGSTVFDISKKTILPEADIMVGDLTEPSRKALIFIKAADCVPLIAVGAKKIALIHAGWRGLAGGAIQAGLAALPSIETVLVGPAAGGCCYEVGEEVISAVGKDAVFEQRDGKLFLDTTKTAVQILSAYSQIIASREGSCTLCSPQFHSFRREKTEDRNIAFAIVRIP